MSTKHTPEPWDVNDKTGVTMIQRKIGWNTELDCPVKETVFVIPPPIDEQQQLNARRIVECVNAMEGVTEPQAFMETVTKDRMKLLRDMNELVSLLEEFDTALDGASHISPRSTFHYAIKAAIQKHK